MITTVYAWIANDPTGTHGILGVGHANGRTIQAVSSRLDLMEMIEPEVQRISKIIGVPVELKKFVMAEVLKEVK